MFWFEKLLEICIYTFLYVLYTWCYDCPTIHELICTVVFTLFFFETCNLRTLQSIVIQS